MSRGTENERNQLIAHLLAQSRERVDVGDGQEALALVLDAIRLTEGESAIMNLLSQAKMKADEEFDRRREKSEIHLARKVCKDLAEADTILAERGDEDILVDAFKDGSSVVCQRCNSLIPRLRAEQHRLFWCSAN